MQQFIFAGSATSRSHQPLATTVSVGHHHLDTAIENVVCSSWALSGNAYFDRYTLALIVCVRQTGSCHPSLIGSVVISFVSVRYKGCDTI